MNQKQRLERLERYVRDQFSPAATIKAMSFKAIKGVVEATVVTLNADGEPRSYTWSVNHDGEVVMGRASH
jgi:hypothetical protein